MFPKSAVFMETDVHYKTVLNTSFGVPSNGDLPRGPPQ